MERKAYVECEHEYGENYYDCSVCHTNLTAFIKDHLNKIILRTLEKKLEFLNFWCPGCRRKLDFSKLGVSAQIAIKSASVKIKRIGKLSKKKVRDAGEGFRAYALRKKLKI